MRSFSLGERAGRLRECAAWVVEDGGAVVVNGQGPTFWDVERAVPIY